MTKTIEFTERGIKLSPQIVDDLTRREFLIGAGLVVLTPACGSDEESGNAAGQTRTIEHAFGEIEVPVNPGRVAVLVEHALDAAIALGVEPAASITGRRNAAYEEAVRNVEVTFSNQEPNVEALARVEPDLILTLGFEGELFWGNYDQLSEVAPTAVFDWSSDGEWKPALRFFADALNRLEEAERMISDYEERVSRLREDLPQPPEETRVAVLQARSEYVANYGDPGSFGGSIVDEVGFAPAEQIPDREISLELIPNIEADHIFVHTDGSGDQSQEALDELLSDPLWQKNRAVSEGQAYKVGVHWFGFGVVAANLVLDDIEEHLHTDDPA